MITYFMNVNICKNHDSFNSEGNNNIYCYNE